MSASPARLILSSDLDYWEVDLKLGARVIVKAHGVTERDGFYVFVALMDGSPPYEYELARFPISAVIDYRGGWA